MMVSSRMSRLLLAAVAASILAGCPLPFEFNGKDAGASHSSDPSSPNMTAPVTVSYAEQGGMSGSIADGSSFVSGKTTTVTLSTVNLNAVIFYTDDGTALTDLRSAKKIDASSGTFTIARTTTAQSLDIHAVAVGSNMLPSPAVHVTVSVSPYPILTVTRDNASISEDGGTAIFTVTSSSVPTTAITVSLSTGGTYVAGDFTGTLPASTSFPATLAAGTSTISFTVIGVHDPATVNHTVTLTIQPDPSTTSAYTVGAPSSASVVLQDDGKLTLTVNSGSNGTTSPAGAYTVSPGVATSISATAGIHYYLVNWTVTAGSGATFGSTGTATSTSPSDTVTLTGGNATVQANFALVIVSPNYYVNATTGNDSNAGITGTTAFKTITKALNVATVSGQTVNVAAGTYSAGETFPLYIPAGVSLIGNETNKGSSTIILGGGTPTVYAASFISNAVVMEASSVLAGFTVTNNSGLGSFPMGILVHGSYSANNVIIRNNTIKNNPAEGIYVPGGSLGTVTGNTLAGNGQDLAFVQGGGNGMSVNNNSFGDLVELDTLGPDLGGGAAGSPGHNSFLGGANPTYFGCGGTVFAENNHWNHSPPTVGAWPGGFDVGIVNSTIVNTTGYY